MALKKSELYFSLWKSCDELRGGMEVSLYKEYEFECRGLGMMPELLTGRRRLI